MELILLLIAHFIGDYVLQSTSIARNKARKKSVLIKHCFIYSICILFAVVLYGRFYEAVLIAFLIGISHFTIDHFRINSQKKFHAHAHAHKKEFRLFLMDQFLHIMILVIAAHFISERNQLGDEVSFLYYEHIKNYKILESALLFLMYLICLNPAGVLIKRVLIYLKLQDMGTTSDNGYVIGNVEGESGFIIGVLERICILTLAILGQFSAISFVMTAKSLARIKMLEEKDFAEKYLVGTLLSLSISLFLGCIYKLVIS